MCKVCCQYVEIDGSQKIDTSLGESAPTHVPMTAMCMRHWLFLTAWAVESMHMRSGVETALHAAVLPHH